MHTVQAGAWSKVVALVVDRRHLGAFAPILAIAATLRLYNLGYGHPGLAIYTSISSHAYKSFHNWFYPNMFADGSILADKPPMFFWYQGLFIALLGPSNLSFRLPSALAGICSVVLVYIIVRRCSGTLPALIAAAALAVMPLDVNYSRTTFIEPVVTVTMLFASYFVVRAVQEKREGFYYAGAFVLGLAFMIKLWQGLLPAPAFALLALGYRWQSWPDTLKTGLKCFSIFLVTAFWWPVVVWLTPGSYETVMHAENVWDMIFGWNLLERFGELEYGARHRQDISWFVTGPMSVYFGASLFPASALGLLAVAVHFMDKVRQIASGVQSRLTNRFPRAWTYLASFAGEGTRRRRAGEVPETPLAGMATGALWAIWLGIAVIAFGGASIRLATYWTVAAPAVAALAGIGIVSIPGLLRRQGAVVWIAFLLALGGTLYSGSVYGQIREIAPYFRHASNVALLCAAGIAVASVFAYFQWRPFKVNVPAVTLISSSVVAVLLTGVVTMHNIVNPRDDTLGRIGFDQIDIPGLRGPEPTRDEERKQRQGALITAIVRTDLDELERALEYARLRRGHSRYLLASDSYNTGAMVSLITGEAVLPLYSEYKLTRLVDDEEFQRLIDEGEIPFILTTDHMLYMDFYLYARMRSSSLNETARAGLPETGELQLLRVTDW